MLFVTTSLGCGPASFIPAAKSTTATKSPNVADNKQLKRIVYFTNWAQYRDGKGRFVPENINPDLCDVINYAFVTTDDSCRVIPFDEHDVEFFQRINALKLKNPQLKTMLSIGGWNYSMDKFSNLLDNSDVFIDSLLKFIVKYGFDGVDLDFEYPGQRGSPKTDVPKFSDLVVKLGSKLHTLGLLFSIDIGPSTETLTQSYEFNKIVPYVDWFNLMAYDLHGAWNRNLEFNAPIQNSPDNLDILSILGVCINQSAIPVDKLVLGIPAYGRGFQLDDKSKHNPGDPATRPSNKQPYTKTDGLAAYYEIQDLYVYNNLIVEYDENQRAVYGYTDTDWFGFDNVRTVKEKKQIISDHNLLGFALWSIDMDDFNRQFPLLSNLQNK